MPSFIAHGVSAIALTKGILPNSRFLKNPWIYFLAMGSAMLPDLDILAFSFGIPYSAPLGHRGFTHSIAFALIWAAIMYIICRFKIAREVDSRRLFLLFFTVTISHGLLDMSTNGGRGVGLFIPVSSERFFFPFRPIMVSPIGMDAFFSSWGLRVLISETIWILLPSGFYYFWKRKRSS